MVELKTYKGLLISSVCKVRNVPNHNIDFVLTEHLILLSKRLVKKNHTLLLEFNRLTRGTNNGEIRILYNQ